MKSWFQKVYNSLKEIKNPSYILPLLVAIIKNKPRYLPDIQWSNKSFTHNFFRLLELIFWREVGIRAESSVSLKDGKRIIKVFTIEAAISYIETDIREWFTNVLKFRFSFLQLHFVQFVPNPNGTFMPGIMFSGIAYDTQVSWETSASSPLTWSHTCTGSNRALYVAGRDEQTITALTYNGVSLGSFLVSEFDPNYSYISIFGLLNPASGANTVSASSSTPVALVEMSISYSGVSAIKDATGVNALTGSVTSVSVSVTTVTNNDWILAITIAQNTPSAGTNQTQRAQNSVGGTELLVGDTNAAQSPAGTYSMTSTMASSASATIAAVAFAPVPVPSGGFFLAAQ